MTLDCLFINAASNKIAKQKLSGKYSAIETPTWALLLAESCRSKGFKVGILDAEAERLSDYEVKERISESKPKIILFVVYGDNPNAGTICMIGASRTAKFIKNEEQNICFVGSHISALPQDVLKEEYVDIIFTNEGVYALHNLLKLIKNYPKIWREKLSLIKGIGFKQNDKIFLNEPERIVPQEKLDEDLPGYAWDLLPYKKTPLDLYRAHYWHANFDDNQRTPFAAIYTSLGCPFGCGFCMINILNRTDLSEGISSADSRILRVWSLNWVKNVLKQLATYGVKTLKFSDELFFFDEKRYLPILDFLSTMEHQFNIWCYARVDSVRSKYLPKFKLAGINWLCLGIESGNRIIRKEVSKGSFKDVKVEEVVREIQNHDMYVLGNYIFGLPEDNLETMHDTLKMAIEMPTEHANFYACVALPGSPIYIEAKKNSIDIPKHNEYEKFAFLSYEHVPLSTKYCSSAEVLSFRDKAWEKYFSNPVYLEFLHKRLGKVAKENVVEMSKIKLRRRILENIKK